MFKFFGLLFLVIQCVGLSFATGNLVSDNIMIELATSSERVGSREPFTFTVTIKQKKSIEGSIDVLIEGLNNFDIRGESSSRNVNIVNGVSSFINKRNLVLYPQNTGSFVIGPATLLLNGQKITSNTVSVEVGGGYPEKDYKDPESSKLSLVTLYGDSIGKKDYVLFLGSVEFWLFLLLVAILYKLHVDRKEKRRHIDNNKVIQLPDFNDVDFLSKITNLLKDHVKKKNQFEVLDFISDAQIQKFEKNPENRKKLKLIIGLIHRLKSKDSKKDAERLIIEIRDYLHNSK